MQINYFTNEGVKGFGNEDSLLLDKLIINAHSMAKVKDLNCDAESKTLAISDGLHVGKYAHIASLKTLEFLQDYICDAESFSPTKAFSYIKLNLENYALKHPKYKDASATLVALHLKETKATVLNTGDSRAYLFRNGKLTQLSHDHTQANQMLKNGEITEAQYSNRSDFYDTLTGYFTIGENTDTPLHIKSFETQKDDVLLLCSDGVSDVVGREEMESLLSHEEKADVLKDVVFERVEDNFSFILVR